MSTTVTTTTNSYHLQLVKLLTIDLELTDRDHKGLRWNYRKFTAYHAACKSLDMLFSDGKWPSSVKRPSQTELVDVFMSRSYWHSHVSKLLIQVSRYPLMVGWLERGDSDDEPSDFDVWHQTKPVYTFKELKEWLKNDGTLDAVVKKKLERAKKSESGKGKQKAGRSIDVDVDVDVDVGDDDVYGDMETKLINKKGKGNKKSHRRM